MGKVIVIEFVTLDGVVTDPDGSAATPIGGWAFRFGPDSVAGDKFRLGPVLDSGVLLLGRRTWQLFSGIWPGRTTSSPGKMNAMPKLVATRSPMDTSTWANSGRLGGALLEVVADERGRRDVVVAGSLSVVHSLMEADLVDEYRLLTFPAVVGGGDRLFPDRGRPVDLRLESAERSGAAVLTRWGRSG